LSESNQKSIFVVQGVSFWLLMHCSISKREQHLKQLRSKSMQNFTFWPSPLREGCAKCLSVISSST